MPDTTPLARSALVREIVVFQIKLFLDGFKDLALLWASLIAGVFDLLFARDQRGAFFCQVLDANEKFEEWLDLNGKRRPVLRGGEMCESEGDAVFADAGATPRRRAEPERPG